MNRVSSSSKKSLDVLDSRPTTSPSVYPLQLSHNEFPTCLSAMETSGMQFGMTVQPFIVDDSRLHNPRIQARLKDQSRMEAHQLARCSACGAYINPLCDTTAQRWFCSLCLQRNVFYSNNNRRHQSRYSTVDFRQLPETQDVLVDYKAELRPGMATCSASERPLVHVFAVQEGMRPESRQAVAEALQAAVAQMHPDVHVALLTFSDRVGVYDLSSISPPTATSCSSAFPSSPTSFPSSSASRLTSPSHLQYPPPAYPPPPGPHPTLITITSTSATPLPLPDHLSSLSIDRTPQPALAPAPPAQCNSRTIPAPEYVSFMVVAEEDDSRIIINNNNHNFNLKASSTLLPSVSMSRTESHDCSAYTPAESAHPLSALSQTSSSSTFPLSTSSSSYASSSSSPSSPSSSSSSSAWRAADRLPEVRLARPLAYASPFSQAVAPLSRCRSTLDAALEGLRSGNVGAQAPLYIGSGPPTVLTSPTVRAVGEWLLDCAAAAPTSHFNRDIDEERSQATPLFAVPDSVTSTLSTLFKNLNLTGEGSYGEMLSAWLVGTDDDGEAGGSGDREARKRRGGGGGGSTAGGAPADSCTGIALHLFVDRAQDTYSAFRRNNQPAESGASGSEAEAAAANAAANAAAAAAVDSAYLSDSHAMATRFAKSGVAVNMWAIGLSDAEELGLAHLLPLSQLTGGKVNKFTLGKFLQQDEKVRLTHTLSRFLTSRLACRGILKLRSSTGTALGRRFDAGLSGTPHALDGAQLRAVGCLMPDEALPGVFHCAAVHAEDHFAFPLSLSENADFSRGKIAVQMAFSYETLVEEVQDPTDEQETSPRKTPAKEKEDSCCGGEDSNYFTTALRSLKLISGTSELDSAAGDRAGRCYSRGSRLMTAKFLRVVTLSVSCTAKPDRLWQGANPHVVSSLLMRHALAEHRQALERTNCDEALSQQSSPPPPSPPAYSYSSDSSSGASSALTAKINVHSPGMGHLVNAAARLALELTRHNMKLEKGAAFSLSTVPAAQLEEALSLTLRGRVVGATSGEAGAELGQHMFAALDLLGALTEGGGGGDDAAVLFALLSHASPVLASRLVRPVVVPVQQPALLLQAGDIDLSRQAMTFSACSLFLLDTGLELVLYGSSRPAGWGTGGMISAGDSDELDDGSQHQSNPFRTANHLHAVLLRKLARSDAHCPRVRLAEGGRESAAFFTASLLQDQSRTGLSFAEFAAFVASLVSKDDV